MRLHLIIFFLPFFLFPQQQKLQRFKQLEDSVIRTIYSSEKDRIGTLFRALERIDIPSKRDSLNARINHLSGMHYYNLGNYEIAMSKWVESAKGYEKINDSLGLSKLYNNMSLILNTAREYKKSMTLKKKALLFCKENRNPKWYVSLLHNIGYTYGALKEKDSFSKYMRLTYEKASEYKDSSSIGLVYNTISENYLKNADYINTLIYADSVQTSYRKYVNQSVYENSLYFSSIALFELKRYSESLKKANESLKLILNNGMIVNASENYEHISRIYEKLGNHKEALKNLRQSKKYKDSVFGLKQQKTALELERKYETEKKEKENIKLKQETVEKDLSISRKNNIILITSLGFGLILMLLIIYQLKNFRDKNKALEASIEKREKAEKELETVRDNISKDFHDDLGNRLARITSLSDLILTTSTKRDKQNVLSAVERIKEDSDALYDGTRDFMFSLKSKSDYAEELFTYLSDFGEEFFQSFDINFFVFNNMDRNIKLPYYWNRQIIMIFKEAMANVVKHSKANNVELHIVLDKNDLNISLKDDGKGFDIEMLKRKNGLKNMQTRAHNIGAKLDLVSSNNGTAVNFTANFSS